LRPAVLDDLGLIPALHSFMKNFTTRTGVHTHLTAFAGVEQLDTAKRTVLYRVAQESLTNVARHAQASSVSGSLKLIEGDLVLEVADDGKGFDMQATGKKGGFGLLGIKERTAMMGGTCSVSSSPGAGTTVTVCVPVKTNQSILPR